MDSTTYNDLVQILFVFFTVLCVSLSIFWFVFLSVRLAIYYSKKKKLLSNSYNYNPQLNTTIFNHEIKVVMYTYFLLLVFSELVYASSHIIGEGLFYYFYTPSIGLLQTLPTCIYPYFDLWEAEFTNRNIALCIAIRDSAICLNLILLVGLLEYVFLAYQWKKDYRSMKRLQITFLCFIPFLFTISIVPQTIIISKVATPLFSLILLILVNKHRKKYYVMLKWRADDFRNEGDTNSYVHHTRIRQNSIITFNIYFLTITILIGMLILNKLSSLCLMLFTNDSMFLTAVYNSDTNLDILNCRYQHIFYAIKYILDLIEPTAVLIALILYSTVMVGVTAGFIISLVYRKCRRIDPKYIRFQGNAN